MLHITPPFYFFDFFFFNLFFFSFLFLFVLLGSVVFFPNFAIIINYKKNDRNKQVLCVCVWWVCKSLKCLCSFVTRDVPLFSKVKQSNCDPCSVFHFVLSMLIFFVLLSFIFQIEPICLQILQNIH